jgi:bacterioferritin (cytochrome b1)
MEEKIDKLQEKCFALLGTLNAIKTGEVVLDNEEHISRLNTDLRDMMEAGAAFFSPQ